MQLASEEIMASYSALGVHDITIRVIIMGKAEKDWAGPYGPRFKD